MTSEHENESWISILGKLPLPRSKRLTSGDIKDLSLVLAARNIPHQAVPDQEPSDLVVRSCHQRVAIHELSLYLKENRSLPNRVSTLKLYNNTLTSLSLLAILGIFHNLTYFEITALGHNPIDWLNLGSADSTEILSGEWWRVITALTLHADGQHLMGNLLIGGYFVVKLCQITGSGLGWLLILAAGSIGNMLNAIMHGPGHNAVGASTAIFGAIGIAGAFGAVLSHRRRLRHWLLPLAAASVLLAFLGIGNGESRTDIGAHLLGFMSGAILAVPAAISFERNGQAGKLLNCILLVSAGVLVVLAWLLALK